MIIATICSHLTAVLGSSDGDPGEDFPLGEERMWTDDFEKLLENGSGDDIVGTERRRTQPRHLQMGRGRARAQGKTGIERGAKLCTHS